MESRGGGQRFEWEFASLSYQFLFLSPIQFPFGRCFSYQQRAICVAYELFRWGVSVQTNMRYLCIELGGQ